MSTAQPRSMPLGPTPVEAFLGPAAASGGPFALLGVSPEACEHADVVAALDRQIARIDQHPRGQTPEADDVRLALHAAAAQLLDQNVRAQMQARWPDRVPPAPRPAPAQPPAPARREPVAAPPVATPQPSPSPQSAPAPFPVSLLLDARRLLAAAGGWNHIAHQRIVALAVARGIAPAEVPLLIQSLARGAGRTSASAADAAEAVRAARPAAPAAPRPLSFVSTSATGGPSTPQFEPDPFSDAPDEADEHAARTLKTAIVLTLLGLGLMVGVFCAVIVLTTPKAPPAAQREPETLIGHTPEPERPEALFPMAQGDGAPARAPAPRSAGVPLDASALLDELRLAIRVVEVDPEAAGATFRGLLARAGAGWPEVPIDLRRALVDAIVEYVYRASDGTEGRIETLEIVAAPAALLAGSAALAPEDVPRIAWSVGLLARLQRERDISAKVGSLIEARLGAALDGARPGGSGGAFDAGVGACLGVMPRRLIPAGGETVRTRDAIDRRLDAWRRWLACVEGVTGSDPAGRATLILSALDTLVHDAGQPTDDRLVFEAMGLLVERLDFSEGGVARGWLVRMLGAPSVDADDLHAITNAVATRAPSAGLDVSMVLAPRATDLERRELRDRLAILWRLEDPADQDALASAWREEWADALDRHASDLTPVEHLASAIVLSRVSEAASLRWRGMTGEAEDLLGDLAGQVDAVLSASARPAATGPVASLGDATWADQYLQAGRSIPIRLDLLSVMSQRVGQSLGTVDAEILVGEAVRGSPVQVQRAAYDIVLRTGSSPAVINALLEELPAIPRTRRTSALITALTGQTLPLTSDPRWESLARRAVVGRLLALLAADGDLRIWDELARLLGWSYLARVEVVAGPPDPGAVVDPPEVGAGLLRSRWRRQGESLLPPPGLGLTFDEIDRRRAARLELAQGPPQVFAAEQLAGLELMAVVVAAEQPQRVEDVRRVLEDLAAARQRASHISQQIAAGEEAGAALWGIRLREALP